MLIVSCTVVQNAVTFVTIPFHTVVQNVEIPFQIPSKNEDIPFQIRRVYYITQVPAGVERGFHSHRALEQVLICLHGSVKVRVKTPFDEEIIELNNPSKGLFIGHMIWREMFDFSDDAVLMVLASEHYNESDYIRDYQQYLEEANEYF